MKFGTIRAVGQIIATGSLVSNAVTLITGSAQVSYGGLTGIPSGIVSGSSQIPSLLPSGTVSGSAQVLNGTTIHSGSFFNGISVISGSAQVDVLSTTNIARLATTGSNIFGGNQTINGSLIVTGSLTAQQFIVSSSVTYLTTSFASGSTKFGDTSDDNHNFTGSVYVNGTLNVNNGTIFTTASSVSIGSTNPTEKLDVYGSIRFRTALQSDSYYATLAQNAYYVGGWAKYGSGYARTIQLGDGISFKISNAGAGNAGDGITFITPLAITDSGNTIVSGSLGINTTPSYPLDMITSSAGTFNTIAQFQNTDYTTGNRTFIRVRAWVNAVGSYSSYFGQGQDGKTYIIANNSARGGDIVIDGGNGNVGVADSSPSQKLTVAGSIKMNQDAALRAGSSDNWIIGQDSGTNVIHLGSASVANDIRFDSSNQSGNVIIKSNGRLGINTTDPAQLLHVYTTTADDNGGTIKYENGNTGTGGVTNAQIIGKSKYGTVQMLVWDTYGTRIGMRSVTNGGSGNIYFTTGADNVSMQLIGNNLTVTGTITENSSIRYKDNIETVKYGLNKVLQMRGVTYTKKDTGLKELGLIAEEVYDILPDVVLKNEKGEVDSVSYGRITAVLIEAIKELKSEIEELKSNR
jgi:hypothetical protein